MPTYVYETIPAKSGAKPRHFEFKQSINDAPLTKHPETGEPIRRVVLGDLGELTLPDQEHKADDDSNASGTCPCGRLPWLR